MGDSGDFPRRQGKDPVHGDESVRFYVANFLDNCSGQDLEKLLKDYGSISKIYIARKRDKGGRRFGFVSFTAVRNKDDLEHSLQRL